MLMMVAGLAACAPAVPESGVGFGDYADYMRDRERSLATGAPPPVSPYGAPAAPAAPLPAPGGFTVGGAAAAIDAAEGRTAAPAPAYPAPAPAYPAPAPAPVYPAPAAPLPVATDPSRPRGNAPAGIKVETGEVQGIAAISDEQDFGAVSSRETIESDAERIARNRANYQIVQPTALPVRPGGSSGPNIVAFALSTTHAPGTPVYRRSGLSLNSGNACGRFASADLAQEAFLADGGPERDRKGLDADGDGFACGWDPRPFRTARQ